MKPLDKMKWEAFTLKEIFSISSTSSSIDRCKLNNVTGDIPYITRSDKDNGWDSLVSKQDNYKQDKENVITIGLDTQTVFYQPCKFYTGQNIQILSNPNLNQHVALFIIPLLKIQMKKFNWGGNGATLSRLKKLSLMLPICAPHTPDFAYMEEFMRNKEREILTKYKKYLDKNLIERNGETLSLDSRRWKEFNIGYVFSDILRGKRLKTEDHIEGAMPYVSSSSQNNGVDNFVSNTEGVRIFGNCLSLANSGSVGETFYHQYDFVASDHVTKLANKSLDKYTYLFISSIVRRIAAKYSFNREINDKRLGREKIMLPVTSYSTPDYAFMSHYMRNLELKQLKTYIDKRLGNKN